MHENVTATPFLILLTYFMRFGVPVVCAALTIDAARRPRAAFGRFGRVPWVVLPLALLLAVTAGFVVPEVVALRLVAAGSVPAVIIYTFVYLLRIVFVVPKKVAEEG